MPVRSIHEGPALTLEILRALPEEERALTGRIMLDWIDEQRARGPAAVPAPPIVAHLASQVLNTLVANKLVCPMCAISLGMGPGRDILGTCLLATMMEGAEVLRWHQLAHQQAGIEEE